VSCDLVVRDGDQAQCTINDELLHKNCDEANRREIARWNEDVRKDKEGRA
jgi:hypothetical protein